MPDMQGTKTQLTLATILLIGATAALYKVAEVFQKIQTWEVIWNPPTVGDLLMAVVFGLAAVIAALGLDVPVLMKTVMPSLFGGRTPPD